MAIEICCDDCGNKYRVGDDKAGSRVRCKECGARIDVPEEDQDDFDMEPETRRRSGSKKKKKSSDGAPVGVIIGVGAVAIVLIIGGILLYSLTGKKPDALAQGNGLPNSNPGFVPTPPAPPPVPASVLPSSVPGTPANTTPAPGAGLPVTAVASNTPAATPLPGTGLPKSTPEAAKLPGGGLPMSTAAPKSGSVPGTAAATPPAGNSGFGGFAAEKDPALDLPPPDNWNVKVDVSKAEGKIDDDKTVNLKIPKGGDYTDVAYSATPSPFVALGNNRDAKSVREIWNLATKQKVGSITGQVIDIFSKLSAISPDGQYFAAGLGFNRKHSILVFQTKGNKALGELESGADNWGIVALLFTSPDRLLALNGNGTAKTWKIPSGEIEHEMALGEAKDANLIAVSPGGSYLAAITSKNTVQVFDLNSAQVVGELSLPSGDNFWEFKVDAMSFSPDGVELGLVGEVFTKGKFLLRYNVADGKLLAKAILNNDNIRNFGSDSIKTNRLEWFPDRSKLLWKGHAILDAKIGGPVWNAPEEEGSSDAPRKLLDNKRILIVYGGRQSPGLKTAPIPLGEIDAAAKVVASGGSASDAGMPTLSKADYDSMTALAPVSSSWSMKPDPAAAGNSVKNSIVLPKDRPSIASVYISRPSASRALVCYTGDAGFAMLNRGFARHGVQVPANMRDMGLVEAYDLTKGGKAIATLPLNYKSQVLHASLDGEHIIVKTTHPKDDRVDVYNVVTGKHIAGWRPFQQADDQNKSVTSALVLDGEYCLTQNVAPFQPGTTYMWKLPECKAVWQIKNASNFCISPGGKYLGFLAESRYLFMEARTGELVGELPVTMPQMFCAFHPMGTHLAVLGSDSTQPANSHFPSNAICRKVAIVDIATGQTTADFYLPQGNDTIQWCGDTTVLVDNTWLVDLKQMKNGWRYLLESGCHAKNQPDGRHWYISNAGIQDQSITLSCATIPEKTVSDKIGATQLPDETLLKPGMQLSLSVNLTNALPPDRPNLATEVGTAFEAGLKKHGYQMVNGAPYVFTITTSQSNTGKNMEFRQGGTVPIIEVKCEVALVANGQAVWKHSETVSNSAFIVFVQRGEDLTTHLSKQMWARVADVLTKFPVPAQVFGGAAGAGLGQSKFTIGGVQPVVGR